MTNCCPSANTASVAFIDTNKPAISCSSISMSCSTLTNCDCKSISSSCSEFICLINTSASSGSLEQLEHHSGAFKSLHGA
ncbi:MAG: hypothetical protein CM15mV42_0360 [uncultured marine virus]|nr:MAG: hypothetical protein CM15mV42_0360 [uncultured marine virus]